MAATGVFANKATESAVVLARVFNAPRKRVFKAWSEPGRLAHWWGPKGFTTPHCKINFRVGGGFLNCMRSPEGRDFWSKGVYREIVAPERIVWVDSFSDEKGNSVPATYYGMSLAWPAETVLTVTFSEYEGKTTVTLRHALGSAPESEREMCQEGWSQSLEKLADYLSGVLRSVERRRKVMTTVKVALFVTLEAKPGKEADVESFLRGGLPIVLEEDATVTWYALRLGPTTFGIFDTFPDDKGRQAHLAGRVAAALMAKASELLAKPPKIEMVDILAAKIPGRRG